MSLTVYHLKNCDTCKKAIKAMLAKGLDLTLVDVREDGISADQLAKLQSQVGYEILLNTRSTTWRGLSDEEKADMNAKKALELMGEYPTLIKRPIIDDGSLVTAGWDKKVEALRTS